MAFLRFIMLYYNKQLFTVNLPGSEPVSFPDSVASRSICRNSSGKVDILLLNHFQFFVVVVVAAAALQV